MSNSSLAFDFDEPSPPVVAMAAQTMASELAAGRTLSRSDISRIMTAHFGGSDALGRWSVRDAHAAIELAQVQYLQASDPIRLSARIEEADRFFCSLEARISTQTNRSEEQIEWQRRADEPAIFSWDRAGPRWSHRGEASALGLEQACPGRAAGCDHA